MAERLLAPHEQPAMIVKRRLEQAGYEVVDKLDELGADDLSFLMKFMFKSVRLGGTEVSHSVLVAEVSLYIS